MRRLIPILVLGFTAFALAQDGPLTNGANLPVRTDANGYLMAAAQTYTGPDGPRRVMANALMRTDANGYLIVTNPSGFMSMGATVASGTAGSVLFVGSGPVLAQDNSHFFWDDSNNRLGLGTTSPSYPLTIHNTTFAGIDTYAHSGTDFQGIEIAINRSRGTEGTPTAVADLDTLGYLTFKGYNSGDAAYKNAFQILTKASGDWSVAGTATAAVDFIVSNGTSAMRFGSDGHVGIGKASNTLYTLDVNSTSRGGRFWGMGTDLSTDISGTFGDPRILGQESTGSVPSVAGIKYGADTQSVWFTGFKTRSTDNDANTIVAANDGILRLEGYAADGVVYRSAGYIELQVDGTPGSGDMPGRWTFWTTADAAATPTQHMVIDSSGDVGIGTITSPSKLLMLQRTGADFAANYAAFEIKATASTASAGPGIYLNGSSITNGAQWLLLSAATGEGLTAGHFGILQVGASPEYRLVINKSGVVGIGTIAFPSTGTQGLVFGDGTALSSMGTNTTGIYGDDVGGTVKPHAIDEAGNIQRLVTPQTIVMALTLQANLGTPADGTIAYCSDCTIANPCAGSGTGAIAKRLNGAWVCN